MIRVIGIFIELIFTNRGSGGCESGTEPFKQKLLKQNIMKKEFLHLATLVVVIAAICLVGRSDYNQEILEGMSEGTYSVLRERLGNVSESKLVDAYLADTEYWDSLGYWK